MTTQPETLVIFEEPVTDYDFGSAVDELFEQLKEHELVENILAEKGYLGGYICIARIEDGLPLALLNFGQMPPEKLAGRIEFSQEKARRLAVNPNDMTSWQSRDPADNKWGGAIRGQKYIYSISGLPEQLDELMSALFAIDVGDLGVEDARAFLIANNNEFYDAKLLEDHDLWQEAA